jgi:hypothetical protein
MLKTNVCYSFDCGILETVHFIFGRTILPIMYNVSIWPTDSVMSITVKGLNIYHQLNKKFIGVSLKITTADALFCLQLSKEAHSGSNQCVRRIQELLCM